VINCTFEKPSCILLTKDLVVRHQRKTEDLVVSYWPKI